MTKKRRPIASSFVETKHNKFVKELNKIPYLFAEIRGNAILARIQVAKITEPANGMIQFGDSENVIEPEEYGFELNEIKNGENGNNLATFFPQ